MYSFKYLVEFLTKKGWRIGMTDGRMDGRGYCTVTNIRAPHKPKLYIRRAKVHNNLLWRIQ